MSQDSLIDDDDVYDNDETGGGEAHATVAADADADADADSLFYLSFRAPGRLGS